MRAVLQRVTDAQVQVDGSVVGQIGPGFLVLLGVLQGDTETDVAYMVGKIAEIRLFEDEDGKMNRDITQVPGGGQILVVSQFTLAGDARKGRRPSFSDAASPDIALPIYENVVNQLRDRGITVQTGVFRAHMHISLTNDGPVTLLLDSRRTF